MEPNADYLDSVEASGENDRSVSEGLDQEEAMEQLLEEEGYSVEGVIGDGTEATVFSLESESGGYDLVAKVYPNGLSGSWTERMGARPFDAPMLEHGVLEYEEDRFSPNRLGIMGKVPYYIQPEVEPAREDDLAEFWEQVRENPNYRPACDLTQMQLGVLDDNIVLVDYISVMGEDEKTNPRDGYLWEQIKEPVERRSNNTAETAIAGSLENTTADIAGSYANPSPNGTADTTPAVANLSQ